MNNKKRIYILAGVLLIILAFLVAAYFIKKTSNNTNSVQSTEQMNQSATPTTSGAKSSTAASDNLSGTNTSSSVSVSVSAKESESSEASTGQSAENSTQTTTTKNPEEMRGIWLAYYDYAPLGLSIFDAEDAYRENVDRFLTEAQKYGINTVFLHARAYDDAFWKSETFHASKYIGGDETQTAAESYADYDPFGLFLEEAHKYGIEVHAWINPYRVTLDTYYDPADEDSIQRVMAAVEELLAFESNGEKIDGIHLDDYFYTAKDGYFKLSDPDSLYAIVASEDEKPAAGDYIVVSEAEKKANVNKLVKEIHSITASQNRTFGISPAGNYDNDMKIGADIDTWLSEDGYIDYIIPQIYWSNQWGEDGTTTMFSDRLDLFLNLRKNDVKFYVGLGLYRTETNGSKSDPGWALSSSNLAEQIEELEQKGADGYVYFSAHDLFRNCASPELQNLTEQAE